MWSSLLPSIAGDGGRTPKLRRIRGSRDQKQIDLRHRGFTTLTKPLARTIADLVASLTLEKANILLLTKKPTLRATISEMLRDGENPGLGALEQMEAADGEVLSKLVER